jgi:hypothetical protein
VEEALLVPNIRFFFEHKPQTVDFHNRLMNVQDVTAGIAYMFVLGRRG